MDKRLAIAREIPRLRRFALALVREHSAADDLVQDTLERALDKASHIRNPEAIRSWMFAIMHNIFRDNNRWSARKPVHASLHGLHALELREPARQADILAALDVLKALAELPTDRREALALVAVEGCSYREASEILAIPIGTLMSRLARGRQQLREALDRGHTNSPSHLRSLK